MSRQPCPEQRESFIPIPSSFEVSTDSTHITQRQNVFKLSIGSHLKRAFHSEIVIAPLDCSRNPKSLILTEDDLSARPTSEWVYCKGNFSFFLFFSLRFHFLIVLLEKKVILIPTLILILVFVFVSPSSYTLYSI